MILVKQSVLQMAESSRVLEQQQKSLCYRKRFWLVLGRVQLSQLIWWICYEMEKTRFCEDRLVDSDEEICKLGGIFCSQCVVL